jgi:hypothetical protein
MVGSVCDEVGGGREFLVEVAGKIQALGKQILYFFRIDKSK